ncbi:MAG: calcium/sodium antiporter [Defluviitaleaceae bacterium]|nr:calcium/sodium antiporter [Defluviitaleaceae bacterium]
MGILLQFALLILGFVLLIKGADIFVDASVNIAKILKIPSIIIGLTIVALGTSLPEAVVSVSAALSGSTDIAVGNVVGSNLFNLLIVVGFSALVAPLAVHFAEISKDTWLSIAATAVLLLMTIFFVDEIPRWGGTIFLAAFIVYIIIVVRNALKHRVADNPAAEEKHKPMINSIFFTIIGIALIVAGGQLTVTNAVAIAQAFAISERIIGLTIVAMGTSLPELVTSVVACAKGENDIAIGNVVGSNIFNILFVLGLTGVVMPLAINPSLVVDLGVLIASSLLFLLFAFRAKIGRFEGATFVLVYAAYMVVIIFVQP